MKTITIAGNVGKDASTRNVGDTTVTGFSVAVEERGSGGAKSTIWFEVSIWGKRGAALESYIRKGGSITVAGELSTREHEGKTYLGIRADQVTLQGGGRRDDGGDRTVAQGGGKPSEMDDIPF